MIIRYGAFAFADHEAMVSFYGAQRVYNSRGRAQTLRRRMVIEGEVVAASATAINTRVNAIQSAFALGGNDCTMYQSDNTATSFSIGPGSLSGCRIVQPPSFALQDGKAHFTTGLPFSIVLEADYLLTDSDTLVYYKESITRVGSGGPRRVVIELDNGVPVEQIVSQNTPIVVVQSGEAVGHLGYPTFNSPIFPAYVDLPDGYQTTAGTPTLDGDFYTNYPVRWSYRMTIPTNATVPLPVLR